MTSNNIKTLTLREKFSSWLGSPLGKAVFDAEAEQMDEVLHELFGYHILQYGYSAESDYLSASRISNKTILFLDDTEFDNNITAIRTRAED
jgi:hypothetical protein